MSVENEKEKGAAAPDTKRLTPPPSRGAKGMPKRKERSSDAKPTQAELLSWFAACGRCSFFLPGYQTIEGVVGLTTAVANSSASWLYLSWNQDVCDLINKSYGSRVDIGYYHFDGTCPECQRHFVFRAAEEEGDTDDFRIEVKPSSRCR